MRDGCMGGRVFRVIALGAVVVAAAPASAGAATQLGQTSTGPNSCTGGAGYVQGHTAAPPTYRVPFDGVITSFTAVHPGAPIPAAQFKLFVLQPVSGMLYRVAAKSEAVPLSGAGLHTFAARVPAKQGQEIGGYGLVCSFASANDIHFSFSGPEPVEGTEQAYTGVVNGRRMNLSAQLERDCDFDGFGDETQDPDISSCTAPPPEPDAQPNEAARTVTLRAKKKVVEKGRNVRLIGQIDAAADAAACKSGQAVDIQRRRKGQPSTAFKRVEQVITDAAGRFSVREPVRKTSIYRAHVPSAEFCQEGISNTQKVRAR